VSNIFGKLGFGEAENPVDSGIDTLWISTITGVITLLALSYSTIMSFLIILTLLDGSELSKLVILNVVPVGTPM
jgi:choline-glycine betaine transporter